MSTHPTAGGNGGTNCKRSAPVWRDLPDDVLGTVRSRLASPRDRACFAAVCRPWRAAASRQPAPPVAPLLLLSSYGRSKEQRLCGPDESWVFRVPSKLAKKRFVGSHDGGWVAALDIDDDCTLSVVNLFSGAEVPLSKVQSEIMSTMEDDVYKIIFSGDPASPNGCILAAIIGGQLHITSCGVCCQDGVWSTRHWTGDMITDIAFCNGELYGLASPRGEVLIKFEIGMEGGCTPVVTGIQRLAIQRPSTWYVHTPTYTSYIFELHGKPSIAARTRWFPDLDPFVKVFELVDKLDADGACNHKWAEVTSFGDYALFIGPTRSKTVHVPVGAENRGLERNHMCYTKSTHSWISELPGDVVHSATSDDGDEIKMYGKKDQGIGDGMERTGYYVMSCNHAMWVDVGDQLLWLS